ncbi:hypothetical protein O181_127544, partial [Austropuccinia psidii MF-1]|nr:hypothetical protein [Austropuccinia psidii MF-1]
SSRYQEIFQRPFTQNRWKDREGKSDSRKLSLDVFLKKIVSHEYHLKLAQQWKSVQPVFHVPLIEPVKQSTIPNQNQLPPPQVRVEEKDEREVAQVLDSKLKIGILWYLVDWEEFNEHPERTTLAPASNPTSS